MDPNKPWWMRLWEEIFGNVQPGNLAPSTIFFIMPDPNISPPPGYIPHTKECPSGYPCSA